MRTAMILAAGLGTRLRPLTDTMPKAMVPYHGTPMIEILLENLRKAGFQRVVINLHHFSEMLRNFVLSLDTGDMEILFSDESAALLNTGGALKHAAHLLTGQKDLRGNTTPMKPDSKEAVSLNEDPILIHNVDIISNLDIESFYRQGAGQMQKDESIGAILVASPRHTSRYLLFDEQDKLHGWINTRDGLFRSTGPGYIHTKDLGQIYIPSNWSRKAFGGIHLISPRIFPFMSYFPESFSIIDFYLSIAQRNAIISYTPERLTLTDIGKLDTLQK